MLDYVGFTRAQTLMRDQFDYPKTPAPVRSHPVRVRTANAFRVLAAVLAGAADRLDRVDACAPSWGDYAASSASSWSS